jgi:hypothetical protein
MYSSHYCLFAYKNSLRVLNIRCDIETGLWLSLVLQSSSLLHPFIYFYTHNSRYTCQHNTLWLHAWGVLCYLLNLGYSCFSFSSFTTCFVGLLPSFRAVQIQLQYIFAVLYCNHIILSMPRSVLYSISNVIVLYAIRIHI